MQTDSKITRAEAISILFLLLLGFGLGWFAAHRYEPPRDQKLVGLMQSKQAELDSRSRTERLLLRAERAVGIPPALPLAILGDGVAGAAAAVNLGTAPVRVFGSRSFWADLHGVGEVWQTGDSLSQAFVDAGLKSPRSFDSGAHTDRLLWLAVENSRLDALSHAHIRYLHSNCALELALIAPGVDSQWRVKSCTQDFEDIDGPLVVATGTSEARTISSPMPVMPVERHGPPIQMASPTTRLALLRAGLLIPGDDYLAQGKPARVETLVVVGSGGNAFDVARHALSEKAADLVIVLGRLDPELSKTPAFDALRKPYGDRICNSEAAVTAIAYSGGSVQLNGQGTLDCKTLNGDDLTHQRIHLLVESLGRVSGDLPGALTAVRTLNPTNYIASAVVDPATGALISVRLDFTGGAHPLLLTGAAADLSDALFAEGPAREKFRAAKRSLLLEINPARKTNPAAPQENPPVGFAAAAFMGSRLARQCFPTRTAGGAAAFDDNACR